MFCGKAEETRRGRPPPFSDCSVACPRPASCGGSWGAGGSPTRLVPSHNANGCPAGQNPPAGLTQPQSSRWRVGSPGGGALFPGFSPTPPPGSSRPLPTRRWLFRVSGRLSLLEVP